MRHGYRNGNYTVLIDDRNGTKVRYTKDGKFVPKFAESIDVTLTYQCDGGCQFCYADCTPDGKHANLMSDSIMEFVDSLAPFTELALNGNDLSIPHLEDFLRILKKKHIFANLTVNQKHFARNIDLLKKWSEEKLIYGLGISLADAKDPVIDRIKDFPNAIIHTVAGILSEEDIDALKNRGFKLLILGYKQKGRGKVYFSPEVEEKISWLERNIKDIIDKGWFELISFDNLALSQLKIEEKMAPEEWGEMYMGDDGHFTFFVDLVNEVYAGDSLTEKTIPVTDWDAKAMFRIIQKERNLHD